MERVFFGPDFALRLTRQRPGVGDQQVLAILAVADEQALDGRSLAATRSALLPASADLRAGDVLVAGPDVAQFEGLPVAAGERLRVLEAPRRVNDGMEQEALLGSVP